MDCTLRKRGPFSIHCLEGISLIRFELVTTVPGTVVGTESVTDSFFWLGRGRPDGFKVEGGVP